MSVKVSDLTVDELRDLIARSVQESIEEIMEDLAALANPEYLDSVREARKDYAEGRCVSLDELTRG
ncbi:MAG: hypothetical protein SGI88_15020 [Candidatus Hydrogenedentes bacterium]|nr:hypothetical protein [Candidatus Hydrogenedentota bacterium]